MNKTNKILLSIIIILAAALVAIVYWQKVGFKKSYWAVYLDTGDLYFGKLSRFPKFALSNAYLLQKNQDNQQNPFSVSKFENAFWAPENKIYLNEKNIVWKAKLKKESQIVNFIESQQDISQKPAIESTATSTN